MTVPDYASLHPGYGFYGFASGRLALVLRAEEIARDLRQGKLTKFIAGPMPPHFNAF